MAGFIAAIMKFIAYLLLILFMVGGPIAGGIAGYSMTYDPAMAVLGVIGGLLIGIIYTVLIVGFLIVVLDIRDRVIRLEKAGGSVNSAE